MIDPEIMRRARQARDTLIARFIHHPAVTLIGIGLAPVEEAGSETGRVVLKIHVRPDWVGRDADEPLPFPTEVDGFPVRVVPGEYDLNADAHPDRTRPEQTSRDVMKLEGGSAMATIRGSNMDQGEDHPLRIPELVQVGGIGPKMAQAFIDMNIRSFPELLSYLEGNSKEIICEEMQALGVGYKPGLFPKEKLIEQIRKLIREREAERPEEPLPEAQAAEALDVTARFTVSFCWEMQPDGSRALCTRVYDERNCGEEVPFYGENPSPWVAWMLEHANRILTGLGTAYPASEARSISEPVQLEMPLADIQVLSVDIFELNASPGKPADRLSAEIQYQLSPSSLERAVAAGLPCQVSVYLRDLGDGTDQLVAVGKEGLIQGQLHYQCQIEFPIPALGHYEIQTEIFLPGVERVGYQGPPFRVSPYIPQFAGQVT